MEYTILIHQAEEGGFWSEVPALPGCYSQGETLDETLENTREDIESHLIALKRISRQNRLRRASSSLKSGCKLRICGCRRYRHLPPQNLSGSPPLTSSNNFRFYGIIISAVTL
ncbi:MAG: type II toxin-antitoxin system HicB family antitoxin [Methanotrichaceae archaeon]|nr:type II toxin-antitoxin system HicB family antitoxin [Methanotrichaceae archaeon]